MAPVDLDADQREFVDAVMLPLGPDQARCAQLEEALAIAAMVPHRETDDGSSLAAERMSFSARGFRFRTEVILLALLGSFGLVAWTTVLGPPALRSWDEVLLANRMSNAIGSMCCSHEGVPAFPNLMGKARESEELPQVLRVLRSMPRDQRLLLVGDTSRKDRVERWRAVHERYPQDPAHYYVYALTYRSAHSAWPDDFVEKGGKLDPDNGWFALVAGAEMAKSAIGVRPPPRITREQRLAARAAGKTIARLDPAAYRRVEILDPGRLSRAYDLIDQALHKPRLDDYGPRLDHIRFEASPLPANFARHSLGHVLAFTQPEDHSTAWTCLRDLGNAFSLSASDAAKRRDQASLHLIQHRVRRIADRLAGAPMALYPQLVLRSLTKTSCEDLAEAWAALDNPSEAGRLIAIAGMIDHKRSNATSRPPDALDEHRGSSFVAQMEGFSRRGDSAPVTEPELRGGRLAEYAMYERFIAHSAAFILCLALAFVLIRAAFEKKTLGLLPERFVGLFTLSDRIRILLLGVVLPFVLYLASTRIAWMDPREVALSETRFFLWLAQGFALVLSVILISLDTAGRCMNRRIPMLALRWRHRDYSWSFGWAALLAMPMASVMSRFNPGNDLQELMFWSSVASVVGVPLLWLVNLAVFVFAGIEARKLHRAILLRTLALPLASAALLVAASIPLLRAEERFWVNRIDFEVLHPDHNIFSPKPEIEYAAWIGTEVRRAAEEMAK